MKYAENQWRNKSVRSITVAQMKNSTQDLDVLRMHWTPNTTFQTSLNVFKEGSPKY